MKVIECPLRLRRQEGSALVTAMMVMLIILPLGLALLAIVDTQAQESGTERTRDRAFNLADSALHSAAFSMSRYGWPASDAALAPSNTPRDGHGAGLLRDASYGATLGGADDRGLGDRQAAAEPQRELRRLLLHRRDVADQRLRRRSRPRGPRVWKQTC